MSSSKRAWLAIRPICKEYEVHAGQLLRQHFNKVEIESVASGEMPLESLKEKINLAINDLNSVPF